MEHPVIKAEVSKRAVPVRLIMGKRVRQLDFEGTRRHDPCTCTSRAIAGDVGSPFAMRLPVIKAGNRSAARAAGELDPVPLDRGLGVSVAPRHAHPSITS